MWRPSGKWSGKASRFLGNRNSLGRLFFDYNSHPPSVSLQSEGQTSSSEDYINFVQEFLQRLMLGGWPETSSSRMTAEQVDMYVEVECPYASTELRCPSM